MSSYPLLRRLPLALDQRVARAGMQICHKVVMQQLYVSRVDVAKQWVVVANASERSVDLTGFRLGCSGSRDEFLFPDRYTLLAGDEVTVWCCPAGLKLDEDNLLQPYLFWTKEDGTLRQDPFFLSGAANEVLLLDPLLVEVASVRVAADGRKEFRVLHCKSAHSRTLRSEIDTRFCVGCLSPPEFETRTVRPSPESGKVTAPPDEREVYVFSRYWGVVSDKSLFAHFLAVFLVPLIESFRAVLIYITMCMFRSEASMKELRPQSRTKVTVLLAMMLACDVMARRLMLCIKSGLLVTIASFSSVVLDRIAIVALYMALQQLYPALSTSFQYMLTIDLGVGCVNAAAVHVRFLEARHDWHPLFKQFARLDHRSRGIICACGIGRELLLHLLLLLPFSNQPSPVWKAVGYLLVPLFTVASGVDFLRAIATLLHMIKIVQVTTQWRRRQRHSRTHIDETYVDEDNDFFYEEEEPQKEDPPMAFFTPKTLRFRSRHPYS